MSRPSYKTMWQSAVDRAERLREELDGLRAENDHLCQSNLAAREEGRGRGRAEARLAQGPGETYTPPLRSIAAWCGVAYQTVKGWSAGISPAPMWAGEIIRRNDPRVDLGALAAHWGARYLEKHPQKPATGE